MKRLMIPFVAAFGLSLGIATGVVMVRTPKALAVVAKAAPVKSSPAPLAPAKPDSVSGTQVVTDAQSHATQVTQAADHDVASAPTSAAAPVVLASAQAPQSTPTNGTPIAAPAIMNPQRATMLKAQPAVAHPITPAVAADTVMGKKLAKVFGAMQARDAARVLEQMDDGDVRTILASLSNKQQAAILGTFPTQRAATIMRATLRNSGGEQ